MILCIRHPKYRGKSAPELSCKTCCSIYIKNLKSEGAAETAPEIAEKTYHFDPYKWIAEKRSTHMERK